MYGFTHPIVVKKKTEIHRKGKAPETRETDIYEPGTISEEELQKRSREYQQNAVLMDRLRGMESYSNFVHLQQVDSLVRAYGRQKDLKGFFQLGRVLNAHSHGKSAEQIKRMIDIQVLGSDAEKEKMWKQIVQECTHLNLNDFDTNDPALFMQSIDYKM
ncbi:MAG: hypothetical protein IJ521_12170, partial [Schwartzia sp.]|nr:hypothetical protein [Schwartzia sp. (in: firmicutes)]